MKENTGFLDEGYEVPKGPSDYMKLEMGENRLRILSKPLVGWSYWNLENKPVRIAGATKPSVDKSLIKIDTYGSQELHHFWALVIYDYKGNDIKVYEITQPSIMNRIKELSKNPDWGNPFGYDLIINKVKEAGKTSYSITPVPPKPVSDAVKAAYKAKPCNLEALLVAGNPFDGKATASAPEPRKLEGQEKAEVAAKLKQELEAQNTAKSIVADPQDDLPFN